MRLALCQRAPGVRSQPPAPLPAGKCLRLPLSNTKSLKRKMCLLVNMCCLANIFRTKQFSVMQHILQIKALRSNTLLLDIPFCLAKSFKHKCFDRHNISSDLFFALKYFVHSISCALPSLSNPFLCSSYTMGTTICREGPYNSSEPYYCSS